MPGYLKKDKDHDVLGNPINPKKLYLPEGIVQVMNLSGKKVFFFPGKFQFQCGKCLWVMEPLLVERDKKGDIKRFYIQDICNCTKINTEI